MTHPLAPLLPPAPLVLASTSPWRLAQLRRLGLPFEAVCPPIDEQSVTGRDPAETLVARARAKAESSRALPGCTHAWIIGADQGVVLRRDGGGRDREGEGGGPAGEELLGKPGDPDRAVAQLMRLSGREHVLLTALCLSLPSGRALQELVPVRVAMWRFSERQARAVVTRDETWTCAGAYKIEAAGPLLMTRIQADDPTAIEGLPLLALAALLRKAAASEADAGQVETDVHL